MSLPDSSILLVEDNRLIAFSLKMELEAMGHTVHTAHNGDDAILQAIQCQPGLILMDIHLNGTEDGIEIMKQIHAQAGFIPNIYLTGYSPGEITVRARTTSPTAIFEKPVNSDMLAATIQNLDNSPAGEPG